MSLALGIDTGGTYTDAVLIAYGDGDDVGDHGRVLAAAKALTTKHDLAIGIRNAVDEVLAASDGQSIVDQVHLVSISTTLATNAIVEGQGALVCMLLLGYRDRMSRDLDWGRALGTSRYAHIPGGHTTDGQEYASLDLEAARSAILEHAPHVAAFGVSGYFGTRNPAHELAVKALVRELTTLPVTCGHELTHRLDALRRATTVALNGRLIPLLCELIDAVEATMRARGIAAPLMVVKGDGSLMAAPVARERPVETILSGPAASVVGAQHLAGEAEAVVADMGGTTTDIAVIHSGQPRLSPEGARVGRWRTMVEAIDVHTVGLGGDSRVWLDGDRDLCIGPRRVVPLCVLATQYPHLVDVLEAQLRHKPQPIDGEFLLIQRTASHNGDGAANDAALLDALHDGPRSVEQVYAVVQHPGLYARRLSELESQGLIVRAGLTPTDAAHVLAAYAAWDRRAAELGAALLARRTGCDVETLCRRILARTSSHIATEVITKLLADDNPNGNGLEENTGFDAMDSRIVARALDPVAEAALVFHPELRPALVGIGAPVATYFPRAAELLHGRLRIPEHAAVANAIGAVVGSVVQRVHALVVPDAETETFRVHLPDEVSHFRRLDAAVQHAEERASALATQGARLAGAQDIRLQVDRQDRSAPVAEDWGDELFLESHILVTAVGRPRMATDDHWA